MQRPSTRAAALLLAVPLLALVGSSGGTPARAEEAPLSIERLLGDGWEIAGYVGNLDVRSSLLLFRKRDVRYLVQCSTLFDVTRARRVVVNCYELH